MKCRFCNNSVEEIFLDLGMSPLANSNLKLSELNNVESYYPLCSYFCSKCYLVQLDEFESPENIFSNYDYYSSFSDTWNKHVESFVNSIISRFNISQANQIIEIASNDGYLLKHFKKKNFPVLGIEPATNIANDAESNGITTLNKFFGIQTARELSSSGKEANILIAFNVLPHVPNLNDFVEGLKILLDSKGLLIIQFSAYLMNLIEKNEFDMIYHEHFSYFSFHTVQKIFSYHKLKIFDVEELSTHGGSLRIYAKHEEDETKAITDNIQILNQKEMDFGCNDIEKYTKFQVIVDKIKDDLKNFFEEAKNDKKKIIGYGAPAKGNTLLNYCKFNNNFMEFTVDMSEHKQGLFLPGTHIPIYNPDKIKDVKPDYIFILPWNLKNEIMTQLKYIRKWGGKFVIPIPEVKIL